MTLEYMAHTKIPLFVGRTFIFNGYCSSNGHWFPLELNWMPMVQEMRQLMEEKLEADQQMHPGGGRKRRASEPGGKKIGAEETS